MKEGVAKLSWEQVCEIRTWHEARGMNASACFKHALELGWPVTSVKTIEQITSYITRCSK